MESRWPQDGDANLRRRAVEPPAETAMSVQRLSQMWNVSPPSVLVGAFGLTLSRLTGVRTVPVDIGRPGATTVRVDVDVDDDLVPAAFLRGVQEQLTRSLGGRAPLEVGYSGEHRPLVLRLDGAARPWSGHVEYPAGTWADGEADGFVLAFLAAVEQLAGVSAAGTADVPLADIRCISAPARKILDAINDTGRVFPDDTVDGLFRAAADRWPDTPAVRDAESTLTYAELAAAASEQAYLLRAAGVGEGDTVLVGVPRSVAEVVAVLGTLWAGAAYCGFDPAQPAAHTAKILAKAAPAAAIVAGEAAGHLAPFGVPLISAWRRGWEGAGQAVPPALPDPDRLAYVAFTSGSTGVPKGVAIPHRGVVRLVRDSPFLAVESGERCLRLAPLAFDASTLEIWPALSAGATLEICPPEVLFPGEIGAFLAERRITVAFLTAGLFGLVQDLAGESLESLRHLMTGGDVVPAEHVQSALRKNPGLVITNCYGPTENTVITTYHSVRDAESIDGPIPIGTPVAGTRIHVLDKRGRLLMPGAVGELYAAGAGLAAGYVNDKAETDRAFGFFSPDVPDRLYRTGDLVRIDADGRLQFLGRADDQVKIRGFRIELHAIKEALRAQDGVEEAFVTVTDGDSLDKRLIAAVRLAPGSPITPADLRDRLLDELPSYMVPGLWAVVDQLPITATGKVDRRRLAAAARPAVSFAVRNPHV